MELSPKSTLANNANQKSVSLTAQLADEILSLEANEQLEVLVWSLSHLASESKVSASTAELRAFQAADALELWATYENALLERSKSDQTSEHLTLKPNGFNAGNFNGLFEISQLDLKTRDRRALAACGILFGFAERATRECQKFCRERRQGGRLIIHWSALAHDLQCVERDLDTLRSRLIMAITSFSEGAHVEQKFDQRTGHRTGHRTGQKSGEDLRVRMNPSRFASLLSDFSNQGPELISRALELMGGAGYMRDYPVADLYFNSHLFAAEASPLRGQS